MERDLLLSDDVDRLETSLGDGCNEFHANERAADNDETLRGLESSCLNSCDSRQDIAACIGRRHGLLTSINVLRISNLSQHQHILKIHARHG